jgi:hypothetical protein
MPFAGWRLRRRELSARHAQWLKANSTDVPDSVLMSRLRILPVSFVALLFALGAAHAQWAYVTHPSVLIKEGTTAAVLPANPHRAFVYCVIASPGKGQPFAPSVVIMGNAATRIRVQYPDRPPQLWGNTGVVWVFSDQIALVSCTEFVSREGR